jgi:hypothetical protein
MFKRPSKRPMKTGARLSSPVRRVPPPIWRALAVMVLAALAGLAAFAALSDDPKTYERESSFVVRPSETVPPDQMADVVGALAPPVGGGATPTIVELLGSARLREPTAVAAGLRPESVGETGAEYSWTASQRPGSAIVEISLTGPSDAKLRAMQGAIPEEAAGLVSGSFGLFRLDSLDAATSAKQVGPKTAQTVALAVLLGALVGISLALVEGRLRSSRGTRTPNPGDRTANPGGDGQPASAEDRNGEPDQLEFEFKLREPLGTRAFVPRVGPGPRMGPTPMEVGYPPTPPKRKTARPKQETADSNSDNAGPKRKSARRKRETGRSSRETAGRKR